MENLGNIVLAILVATGTSVLLFLVSWKLLVAVWLFILLECFNELFPDCLVSMWRQKKYINDDRYTLENMRESVSILSYIVTTFIGGAGLAYMYFYM